MVYKTSVPLGQVLHAVDIVLTVVFIIPLVLVNTGVVLLVNGPKARRRDFPILIFTSTSVIITLRPLALLARLQNAGASMFWYAESARRSSLSWLWQRLYLVIQFTLLPIWFSACLFASVSLSFIIFGAGALALLLQESYRQLCKIILHGSSYDPATAIYSRYTFEASTSPLMRLPPEIRLQIWQEVFGFQGNILVLVSGANDAVRLRLPPICRMNEALPCGPAPDVTFLRVCRQLYAEADHLFYSMSTFTCDDPAALVRFIDNCTIVQRRNTKKLSLRVYPGFFRYQEPRGNSQSSLTQSTLTVRFALERLPCLRIFHLWVLSPSSIGDKYLAQGVYQISNNISISQVMKVTLCDSNPVNTRTTCVRWPDGCRKEFANAVWARIHRSGSPIQRRGEVLHGRAKYEFRFLGHG